MLPAAEVSALNEAGVNVCRALQVNYPDALVYDDDGVKNAVVVQQSGEVSVTLRLRGTISDTDVHGIAPAGFASSLRLTQNGAVPMAVIRLCRTAAAAGWRRWLCGVAVSTVVWFMVGFSALFLMTQHSEPFLRVFKWIKDNTGLTPPEMVWAATLIGGLGALCLILPRGAFSPTRPFHPKKAE